MASGFDVYKLHGVKCPECDEVGKLRILIADEDTEDDDVVICSQCEKLEVEIAPVDLAAIIQEILVLTDDWGEVSADDVIGKVVDVLDLDQ